MVSNYASISRFPCIQAQSLFKPKGVFFFKPQRPHVVQRSICGNILQPTPCKNLNFQPSIRDYRAWTENRVRCCTKSSIYSNNTFPFPPTYRDVYHRRAMKSVWKLAFVLAAVAMVISGGGVEATVSCFTEFIPCLPFAANNAPQPTEGCCNGLRRLEGKAKSSEQRRQLCDCIQSIATAGGGVFDWGKAAKLPSICRVDLGFPLNPSLNCALF